MLSAEPTIRLLNIGGDIPLRLSNVLQSRTKAAVTDAVVTAVLYPLTAGVQGTAVGTYTLTFVAGTELSPIYDGTIPASTSAALTEDGTYRVIYTAVSPTKGTDRWTIECVAGRRGER